MNEHCAECGMLTTSPREFHPHWFCVLFKAGVDPRRLDPAPEPDVKRLAVALRAVMAEPTTGDAIFAVGRGKWDEFAERVAREYRAWKPVALSPVGGTDG